MLAPINGKLINLRPLRTSDADSIRRHARHREISRYTFIPHPYRIEHARRFLDYARTHANKQTGCHLGIEDKTTGQIVGVIGLEGIDLHNGKTEIGYWLGKEYWHRGMAGEAVRLMLAYCFGTLKLKRVYAHVFVGNVASERLLLRLGFTLEGIERSSRRRGGRGPWVDCIVYSILREEFRMPRVRRVKLREAK